MEQNNSKEINFQHYVDGVKEKKITWNFFTDLMEDLTYCDIKKLGEEEMKCKKNVTMAPENEAFSENLSYK